MIPSWTSAASSSFAIAGARLAMNRMARWRRTAFSPKNLDIPTKGRAEALQIGCYKGGRRCAEKQSEAGQLRRQFPPGSRIRQKCFLDFRRASDQQIVHIVDSRLPKDPRGFRWYAKSFK